MRQYGTMSAWTFTALSVETCSLPRTESSDSARGSVGVDGPRWFARRGKSLSDHARHAVGPSSRRAAISPTAIPVVTPTVHAFNAARRSTRPTGGPSSARGPALGSTRSATRQPAPLTGTTRASTDRMRRMSGSSPVTLPVAGTAGDARTADGNAPRSRFTPTTSSLGRTGATAPATLTTSPTSSRFAWAVIASVIRPIRLTVGRVG
jgi:hypothetical protein